MATNLECELCGGKSFYKEAGFFYCNECQTQTQELVEQEFEEECHLNASTVRKRRTPDGQSKIGRLTSWECYNYILHGLVEELLELGATSTLRKVVRVIWLRYLRKLGVLSDDPNHTPLLGALNSTGDAQIIYGVSSKKRRRRRQSSSANSSSSTSTNSKFEMNKRKRALIKVEQETASNVSPSMLTENLSSYQSTAVSSSASTNMPVQYNNTSYKELRKLMSRDHLKAHRKDKENELYCHNISSNSVSWQYIKSPYVITRKTIFAILYLGLAIIKDKIQLSDMLRYINEGHLSFNEYLHFFPETLGQKKLNIFSYNKHTEHFVHPHLRKFAWRMAKFVDIQSYVPLPNIIELSERFCLELNLPEEVHECVVHIVARTKPFVHGSANLHDCEGRTISYIIFILKLLFGLDGKTEYEMEKFADIVNERIQDQRPMFNIIDWFKFIEYRKLVLHDNHFPSHSQNDREFLRTDLFVDYLKSYNTKYDIDCSSATDTTILKDILTKLPHMDVDKPKFQRFPHTLTPFHTYLSHLLNEKSSILLKYNREILEKNFRDTSLDFVLSAENYLSFDKLKINHGGANDNLTLIETFQLERDKNLCKNVSVFVTDAPVPHKEHEEENKSADVRKLIRERLDGKCKEKGCYSNNKRKYLKNCQKFIAQDFYDKYLVHYQPHEKYLLRVHPTGLTEEEFKPIYNGHSSCFRILLKECARITEHTLLDLYEEFCRVEQFLAYNFNSNYTVLDKRLEKFLNDNINEY